MGIIVAVDPGLPLTIAALNTNTGRVTIYEYDLVAHKAPKGFENCPQKIAAILATYETAQVVVEKVAIYPGEDVRTGAAFVGSMYLVVGICAALRITCELAAPAHWKRAASVPGKGEPGAKRRIVELARERLPQARALFDRVKDHNRADAALLAHWWAGRA